MPNSLIQSETFCSPMWNVRLTKPPITIPSKIIAYPRMTEPCFKLQSIAINTIAKRGETFNSHYPS